MARPKKKLDWNTISKLCAVMCTHEEIASLESTTVETLHRDCLRENKISFSEYYKQKSAGTKASLRRKQIHMALNGDRVMSIWTGKQYLEQTERVEQKQISLHLVDQFNEMSKLSQEELAEIANQEILKLTKKE